MQSNSLILSKLKRNLEFSNGSVGGWDSPDWEGCSHVDFSQRVGCQEDSLRKTKGKHLGLKVFGDRSDRMLGLEGKKNCISSGSPGCI